MAQSRTKKKLTNMAYGLGASVVILGALFKIMHFKIGPLTGGVMLTAGLVVEALIFAMSAFEPIEEELDWSKVYPELAGGQALGKKSQEAAPEEVQGMLSEKLDTILKEAKLDANLISSLGESIKGFQGAAEGLTATSTTVSSTNQYNEQMSMAAAKLESLNGLYTTQVENAAKQSELNSSLVENSQRLQEQMQSLATNLSSLNGVYGGMLTAMSTK
ncbi:gliding motility protein GldL [Tenacibaculum finnmarkense genomovar finnmarkense]|uniref:type IX secretion system motor protein PorL/GldL n=1 Tax=Tenacibaculum finnmarkense TaxID=2781243 RepID=UPI001E504A23|nr:gliding motility protein GldL [Tenacibaculum finnmarkense]MCD8416336.1 gliding motility protein GldL [Tenacibaculum finnmarkense genomovar finnmarkense]MCG8184996.1 gliding motility protein GldL [Tenacibaculum finnmarkense genomovar finnmarkense]MCG8201170.1 gliding motility protein GldL [Tenacibaculum finnmarkense genomovar finnmarkense]MCG8208955.1 gliding motility protein GldL [Tenacibaculum finnmarkense genomovar finnmarkense]MCG8211730.1 gliding motility protein GldL [Tenacibaculum fin